MGSPDWRAGRNCRSHCCAVCKYVLDRRRASDKELFLFWRQAFNRPAFRGPFSWQTDPEPFRRAIEITLKAVNTGVLQDRRGQELGRSKGTTYIRSRRRRSEMERVTIRLKRIHNLMGSPRSPESEAEIDSERNEVIKTMNGMFNELKIHPLPIPTEIEDSSNAWENV
jgi:hypothetical protein